MATADSPALRTLAAELGGARFLCGVEEGRWKLLKFDFPHLHIRVKAIDADTRVQVVQDFHLVCDDYPSPGPFVEAWDFEKGCRPAQPSPGYASPAYCDALKDWGPGWPHGQGGVYRGWQRYAALHNDWASKRPDQAWNLARDISFLMERMYELVADEAAWLGRRQSP